MRACSRRTCRSRSTCSSDILSEPAFDREELIREQNVIVQEIGAVADTPDDLVFEHLQVIAFPDQPLGRSILGTPKTVRSFDGGRLRDYLGRHYRAPDIVVAAAGAVDHAAVVAEVERRFASFNGPAEPRAGAGTTSAAARTWRSASSSRSTLRWRLPGVSQTDPSLYSLQVFTNVLGGGMSSRLFQEAREKRGLCYSIYSFHAPYSDVGMFGLYAGTDAADTSELMRLDGRRDRQHRRDHFRDRRSPAPRRR